MRLLNKKRLHLRRLGEGPGPAGPGPEGPGPAGPGPAGPGPAGPGPEGPGPAGPGPARLALHGFGGSGQDFEALAGAWGPLLAPDLPGHGRSPVAPCPPDEGLAWTLEALGALVQAQPGPVDLIAYSLGGRLALHLLLAHPGAFRRVVLIGASAGLEDPQERAARMRSDEALAARALAEGAAAFARWWATQPLIATQAAIPAPWGRRLRARRARARPEGLAWSLRALGAGALPPLWDRLAELRPPALVLWGEHDPKYAALGRRLAAAWPGARGEVVPGAGHCAHLEAPGACGPRVGGFLRDPLTPAGCARS